MLNLNITTMAQLLSFVSHLSEQEQLLNKRSLETYFRALFQVAYKQDNSTISPAVAASLFASAVEAEPSPFDNRWLSYGSTPNVSSNLPDTEYFKHILCFQIADLYRIEQVRQASNTSVDSFGPIQSPTNHNWYNSTTAGYLEAAAGGYFDHCKSYNVASNWMLSIEIPDLERIGRPLESTECR